MIRLILFGCIVVAVMVGAAHAQTLPGGINSRQFNFELLAENHLRLTGQVQMDGEDGWQFHADQVDIFSDESRLVASGNVLFTAEGGRIAADRAEFDIDSMFGTFYNASGSTVLTEDVERSMFGTQEPEMRFWGEIIERLGPRTYRLTRGGFTSCVQPTSRWEVTASSATINLDEYAVLRNAVLSVKGVPLFYLPAMYFPIQEDGRATGVLMPTYGASTIRGQSISNAFFMAVNRSQDATIFHDWFASTGQGLGGEYRYVLGAASQGNARTYLLNEHQTTIPDRFGGESTLPGRRSYELRSNARHRISDALTARGQVDYFSDVTVRQTYQSNIFEASNSSRSFGGNVTGSWSAYTLSGTGDVNETFFGDTQSTLHGAGPRVSFNQAERPLLGSPVYFAFTSEYANLLRRSRFGDLETESGLSRIDVNPLIRAPFTRWPFLTLNSSVAWRQTYWTESIDEMTRRQLDNGISRSFLDLQTQITGPVFVKVWDTPNSGYSERMKHVIEPWMNIQRITAIDNFDQIVRLEGTDSIVGNVTQIRYGLNNRLYARRAEGEGPSVAREILTVTVQQSYYTDANAAKFDRQFQTSFEGTQPSNFSPVSVIARAGPTRELSGTLRAEYDTQFWALRTISADANIDVGGWLNQTAGWSQRRFVEGLSGFDNPDNLAHYLNSFTNLRTRSNRFGGVYQLNYDIQRGRYLQQRVLAYYNAQCCGISIEYQSYNLEGLGARVRVDQDRRFNLSFTLAGLGTFSNMLGAFGVGAGNQR